MKNIVKLGIILAVLSLALLGITACGAGSQEGFSQQMAKVERGDLAISITGSGTIEATRESRLTFGSAGKVERILVKEGDKVKEGDVVVVRYEGPKGGPGMQEMLAPTSYIAGAGLADSVALITDGRFSGGSSGCSIGHISPEAAVCGPIGLLKDGDIIEIDIPGNRINVKLSDDELAEREKTWTPPAPKITEGCLAKYASMATSADTGAVLKW